MKGRKPNDNEAAMIRRRGMIPKDYLVVRNTYSSLWLLDLRFGRIKILYKRN